MSKILRPELLLNPPSIKSLWGLAPRVFMTRKQWDLTRNACYARSEFSCDACGIPKHLARPKPQLDCHECYNFHYEEGIVTFREFVSLCGLCHNYIHYERLAEMTKIGLYQESFQKTVIAHGESVLKNAGITQLRPIIPNSPVKWQDWRITFDGETFYSSQFVSEAHCDRHYALLNQKAAARKKTY